MKNIKTVIKSKTGTALITGLMVMLMISMLGISYLTFVSTNLMRADKDARRTTAFYLAEAGIEYMLGQMLTQTPADVTIDSSSILNTLRSGATGTITVTMDSGSTKHGIIVSSATFRNQTQTIRVRFKSKSLGIWDNAIFAGVGQAGLGINGNVDVRGSVHILGEGDPFSDLNGNGVWDDAEPFVDKNNNGVFEPSLGDTFTDVDGNGMWSAAEPYQDSNMNGQYDPPLTATELATDISGNANIGNNYNGIPSSWLTNNKIPALGYQSIGGESMQTLEAELRVKHGKVNISGNATVGDPNITGNGVKETVDGTYVTDGYGGNQGITNVSSDNGTTQGYDLGDRVSFPSLFDPYIDSTTGTSYSTYEDYLDSKSLLVNKDTISSSTSAFSLSVGSNSISWNPSTGVLTVNGIIRFPGNLHISAKNQTVKFAGRGTLFAKGNVYVHGNVMPVSTFPTVNTFGVISRGSIDLATGGGESQIEAMGAWFAQGTIRSAKQSSFAGTYVANYFDMGSQVPSIYQVPALSTNLPPGMPGADQIIRVVQSNSWRHL